ncbi:MAG: hypothetical protein KF706_03405 [Chitinophagales bacterium]|nr:hypothetical protein [Chitinophagales bacterium]
MRNILSILFSLLAIVALGQELNKKIAERTLKHKPFLLRNNEGVYANNPRTITKPVGRSFLLSNDKVIISDYATGKTLIYSMSDTALKSVPIREIKSGKIIQE